MDLNMLSLKDDPQFISHKSPLNKSSSPPKIDLIDFKKKGLSSSSSIQKLVT